MLFNLLIDLRIAFKRTKRCTYSFIREGQPSGGSKVRVKIIKRSNDETAGRNQ
jgi:hypothetical protein